MYKCLETIDAKFEQNRVFFEQGGWGEQVLPGRHFWKSRDLNFLARPFSGGYVGSSKITLSENLFASLQKWKQLAAMFLISREIKVFL